MKILHTADWHLGKKLDYYSRFQEQEAVLNEICTIADAENVDVVLVAGDIFDTFNPPVEATELLYRTLRRLSRQGKRPVIAIAGNHDSPDRIEAPDALAKACGILFVGYPNLNIAPYKIEEGFEISRGDNGFVEIQLPQYHYPLRIITTAFANEQRLKQYLGRDEQEGLNEALRASWQYLADTYCDDKGVNLLCAHLYMNKAGTDAAEMLQEPESEKPLNIGFANLVYTNAIPARIQYTALGHLHRYHNIGSGQRPVVYSGSPLCYSFSEAGQEKGVVIIDIEPAQSPLLKLVPLQEGRALCRKKFEGIEEAVTWLQEHPEALVELTIVTQQSLSQADKKALEKAHNGIVYIIPKLLKAGVNKVSEELYQRRTKSIEENFAAYYRQRNNGQEPASDLLAVFKELIATASKEN